VLQLDPSIIPDNVHGFVVFLQSGDAPLESCELACSRLSPLPSSLSAGSGLLPSPRGATGGLLPSPRGGCSGGGSGSSGTCTTATGGVLLSPRGGGSGRPLSSGPIPTATATMTATGTQSYLDTTHDTTRRTTREMQRNQTCLISIEKQRQHNYYLWFMYDTMCQLVDSPRELGGHSCRMINVGSPRHQKASGSSSCCVTHSRPATQSSTPIQYWRL